MSSHIHTAILFIIYSKYVHVYASVFAQQMPVSGPRDKMKARPLGQKSPEKQKLEMSVARRCREEVMEGGEWKKDNLGR